MVVVVLWCVFVVCVVCVCSKLLVGVFKIFGPLPRPLSLAGPPFPWTAQNFAFFSLSPAGNFILSSLSGGEGGLLVELWPRFKAMVHPKCGFRLVSFCVCSFLALGAGRRAALFSVWLFMCVFVCVFSSFRAFLGSWRPRGGGKGQRLMTADWGIITAAGEAYDSGREAHYWGGKGL